MISMNVGGEIVATIVVLLEWESVKGLSEPLIVIKLTSIVRVMPSKWLPRLRQSGYVAMLAGGGFSQTKFSRPITTFLPPLEKWCISSV